MMFSLCIWLKQHRMAVGGVLLAIAITACNASAKSQLPSANTPSIASPLIAPSSTPPSVFLSQSAASASTQQLEQEAVQAIRNYYSAINRRDYQQAYSAWDRDGAASQQSFEQFKQGFANTASTAVTVGEPGRLDGAAGSTYIEIPVTVTAVTKNGTRQRFRGSYVLRRVNDVPGSTLEQRRWHLYSAHITRVN
ncbi:MAG TPA: hypothetical protein V6D11_13670 [Waterburya sp.]|jgi:hypothetical protein